MSNVSPFASPPTSASASASPPDSPTVLTPTNFESNHLAAMAMTAGKGSSEGARAGNMNAYGLSLDDLPPLPSSNGASPLIHQSPSVSPLPSPVTPHFVARTMSRSDSAYASSAQPSQTARERHRDSSSPFGERRHGPSHLRPDTKDHIEFASPYRAIEDRSFPLSTNGSAHPNHATIHQPEPPTFYTSVPWLLAMYFCFNLGLTLFNKVVLVSFPFPYTLTGLHALSGCAGTWIAHERNAFTPARLTRKENLILAAFSVLYTINIAVSNISLQLVTVPFHQVVRAATPLFTIFITATFLRQRFSLRKMVALLPVVAGVGLATYGDYYFTTWGLVLTLLGTFLAALKTVVTNVIQTGGGGRLKLHPLDLLMRMSPLAFVQCVIYGWYTGELERVRRYGATQMTRTKAIALLINGIIACGLNIVSFTANKKAGALTMTVSANCKQVLTIAVAVILFNLRITGMNAMGILLTLLGGAWYAYVEYGEKKKKHLGARMLDMHPRHERRWGRDVEK